MFFFFFKQETAYEMRISDWSSDVCSSDLDVDEGGDRVGDGGLDLGDVRGELLVTPGAAAEEHPERRLVGCHEAEVGPEPDLDLLVRGRRCGGGLGDLEIGRAHV